MLRLDGTTLAPPVLFLAIFGVALVANGIRHLLIRHLPKRRSARRAWRSAAEAATFWTLLGTAVLFIALIHYGWSSHLFGGAVGFVLYVAAITIILLAVTVFRPRLSDPEKYRNETRR
jgi:hypothetical protein